MFNHVCLVIFIANTLLVYPIVLASTQLFLCITGCCNRCIVLIYNRPTIPFDTSIFICYSSFLTWPGVCGHALNYSFLLALRNLVFLAPIFSFIGRCIRSPEVASSFHSLCRVRIYTVRCIVVKGVGSRTRVNVVLLHEIEMQQGNIFLLRFHDSSPIAKTCSVLPTAAAIHGTPGKLRKSKSFTKCGLAFRFKTVGWALA